jgi:molybdate transport system substrate-binding protein
MRKRVLAVVALLAATVAGACGGPKPATQSVRLTVLAAASLKGVFPKIGDDFMGRYPETTLDFSFAGTDQLAAQIEQGAPADVFAGASTKYGDQLADKGLIEPYARFCTNQLVLITPASNPAGITSLQDLSGKSYKLVIGSESVPIGSYTRTVLSNLDAVYGAGYSDSVLANVVSDEDSVTSILTKVQSGEADAGFVYVTDARSAGSDISSIALPDEAKATATYPIAVVKASSHRDSATAFVDFVRSDVGQELLQAAGFGPPPSS